MRRLRENNEHSNTAAVAPGGPTLSMTTYGARLENVFYTIESIAAGSLRPSRLVLWIDAAILARDLPQSLRRLMLRGLEVHGTRDVGPHTKYFPQVMSDAQPRLPLVTADDDILYPPNWLADLSNAVRSDPEHIHCFRAHNIQLTENGNLAPYASWPRCMSRQPSFRHFATGVGGIVYPVAMQEELRRRGDAFLDCCPAADDIWINVIALRSSIRVRQIEPLPRRFYELPNTRAGGLARQNNQGGGNDRQLTATYTTQDIEKLRNEHNG